MSDQIIEAVYEYIQQVKTFTPKHQYYDMIYDPRFTQMLEITSMRNPKKETEMKYFEYKKVDSRAKAPEKVPGNCCYDLSCVLDAPFTLQSNERYMFATGLILKFPEYMHGIIKPRSGLALKHGIDVLAGVIDNSFALETKIILINTGDKDYVINNGDRIAQIMLVKDYHFPVREIQDIQDTGRGLGFGSSGK